MAKDKQITGPEQAATSRRRVLLELMVDVLKAQETKPDELKAKQQRLVEMLRRNAGKKT